MSIWSNKWTCPEWVLCTRKPHTFGNEYHIICCGMSGIMFSIELAEGKDHPREIPPDKYGKIGNAVGFLVWLCCHIYSTSKVVILDNKFCVLQGIIELRKFRVLRSAIIKKRWHFPTLVPGDAINNHFYTKIVGDTDNLKKNLGYRHYKISV